MQSPTSVRLNIPSLMQTSTNSVRGNHVVICESKCYISFGPSRNLINETRNKYSFLNSFLTSLNAAILIFEQLEIQKHYMETSGKWGQTCIGRDLYNIDVAD